MTTMAEPAPAAKPKAKRKPPTADPLSPHAVRSTIVNRLISQESLKGRGAWPRELQILKRLQQRFGADDFWLTLTPAEKLHSLTYFVAPFGAGQLQEHWNLYLYSKAQDQQFALEQDARAKDEAKVIDSPSIRTTLESTRPQIERKQTAAQWADS